MEHNNNSNNNNNKTMKSDDTDDGGPVSISTPYSDSVEEVQEKKMMMHFIPNTMSIDDLHDFLYSHGIFMYEGEFVKENKNKSDGLSAVINVDDQDSHKLKKLSIDRKLVYENHTLCANFYFYDERYKKKKVIMDTKLIHNSLEYK